MEKFFLGGRSSGGETKIAEGIRDAKNRRFVLYIAFAAKVGATAPPPMTNNRYHYSKRACAPQGAVINYDGNGAGRET